MGYDLEIAKRNLKKSNNDLDKALDLIRDKKDKLMWEEEEKAELD
jgi:hypothetical protein